MNKETIKTLAKEVVKTPREKLPLTFVKEEVPLADGTTFVPMPVKNSSDVLEASLLMLFKHIADMHYTVVEIIADKFGHKTEELHKAIVDDPRWEYILKDPLVVDLTASTKKHSVAAPKKKTTFVTSDEPELVFD